MTKTLALHQPKPLHHHLVTVMTMRGVHSQLKAVEGFNAKAGVLITRAVGTMACAYIFAVLAFAGLPTALAHGGSGPVAWLAQTFLQLVLLSIIIVGQNVQALAAEDLAHTTYLNTGLLLNLLDLATPGGLTEVVHRIDALEAKLPRRA